MSTSKSDHQGHRKRLKQKFEKAGLSGFLDHEILEFLLTFSIPRKDTKPAAKALLDRFKNINAVLDADIRKLTRVPGIGANSGLLIKFVKALCEKYLECKMQKQDVLNSPEAVLDFARMKLEGSPSEIFAVIYLNTKNEVLGFETIQEGIVDRSIVYPRKLVEKCFEQNAAGLILIHNHPSGHPEPSSADKKLTAEIVKVMKSVEIRVLDHLIIGKHGYFSFLENNLIRSA